MQKLLFLAPLAALVLGMGAASAHADTFTDGTLNFTVADGSPTPSGSFVYDHTTDTFTSFTVDWDGAMYDFAEPLNPEPLSVLVAGGNWCAAANTDTPECPATNFILDAEISIGSGSMFTDDLASADGTFTVTETTPGAATPEPSTLALLGMGILGMAGVTRRRFFGARR